MSSGDTGSATTVNTQTQVVNFFHLPSGLLEGCLFVLGSFGHAFGQSVAEHQSLRIPLNARFFVYPLTNPIQSSVTGLVAVYLGKCAMNFYDSTKPMSKL